MSLDLLLQQITDPSQLSWKDETYDLALAQSLSAEDRARFIAKLIEEGQKEDKLAILTLGYLEATEALPMLRALAAKGATLDAAMARRALVLLGKGEEVLTQIADDALHGPRMVRVGAVMNLAKVGGEVARAALRQALLDEDSTLRSIAFDAVLDALDLTRRLKGPDGNVNLQTEIELMGVFLGQDVPALAKLGAHRIAEILQSLEDGATPEELGIAWRPNQAEAVFEEVRGALYEPETPFPFDEIESLNDLDRQWAEAMIVFRLKDADARVPDALVKLRATWLATALAEISEATDSEPELSSELRAKVADAARALGARPGKPFVRVVETFVTIIASFAVDPDELESMAPSEYKERCGGWKELPVRSGRYLDTFLMKATGSDFMVFASGPNLRMIGYPDVLLVIPELEALVEQKPEDTARALVKHGGGTASIARVTEALKTGALDEDSEAAEEAAAFAFYLLQHARYSKRHRGGLIWEYRGPVTV